MPPCWVTVEPSRPKGVEVLAPTNFLARLRRNAFDSAVLANPLVAAMFCLFRWLHFIALEPYWLYVSIVVGCGVAQIVYSAAWAEVRRPWHLHAYIGASVAATALVAYSTGWGPILSIGFLFGAATSYELFGARAKVPTLVCTTVAMALGQVATVTRCSLWCG
jgi:hypothetical protein